MGCVVIWHHHDWDEPAYQLYSGLLFGLPLAVSSFNRLSRLLESLCRRLGGVLISFYFDDGIIIDPQSARGSGQWAANEICRLVGSPFAAEKQQTMQSEGTSLGLTHDFSVVSHSHCVNFWARQRLHDKIQDLIDTARNSERLPKGVASKIYGVANFLGKGIFGRVGYGRLIAIKDRQDEDVTCLTPAILQCFEVIEAVMKVKPFRRFPVSFFQGLRFLAASDAAEEADKPGSGGFHSIFFDHDGSQHRQSFVAGNCQQLQRMWAPGQTHIAQLELSMVLFALFEKPALFRDWRGLWFLDNVAAVMTLIKGRSSNPDHTAWAHDPPCSVCPARPGILGVRAEQEQLGGRH